MHNLIGLTDAASSTYGRQIRRLTSIQSGSASGDNEQVEIKSLIESLEKNNKNENEPQ